MINIDILVLKAASTYIVKGKILPNWLCKITKGDKSKKHKIKSLGMYYIKLKNGNYLIYPECDGNHSISIHGLKNTTIKFLPYGGGHVYICDSAKSALSEIEKVNV